MESTDGRIVVGILMIVLGLVMIVFHEELRKFQDKWYERDPLLKMGDWWTGKYSSGGLLFVRFSTILVGAAFTIGGLMVVLYWN